MISGKHLRPLRLLRWVPLFWALAAGALRSEPVITEFMAANNTTLADEDGTYSDWVEIHNPGSASVSLGGWFLTDSASNKAKWQFPAVTLPPGGYLIVFASNKNRAAAGAPLHTNFALSADGEYLGLIKPDGSAASEFAPKFPTQLDDISYGVNLAPDGSVAATGYLISATPGAANPSGAVGGGGGPGAIQETITFSRPFGPFRNAFTLELSGGNFGQQIRYTLSSGVTAGGTALVTANSTLYTGPITIDRSSVITAAVFSADGTAQGPVSTAYYARVSPGISTFSSQLPVVVIDNLGAGQLAKDGVDHPSWLYLYAARGNGSPSLSGQPELISPLTTTVRGSSSAEFPKKGYNVKFTDEEGRKRSQALLDLPAYEKWALVAPWSFDLTYINNSFVYALSNDLGRWAPRTRLVEVFFNADGGDIEATDYAGIYAITDRVEVGKGRVNISTLSASDNSGDAITGGYLLKIDPPDSDELSWVSQRGVPEDGVSNIVLVSPKADDVTPAQVDYIRNYVQRMEDSLHADRATNWAQRTYLDYIDRGSWIDHHLLNTFVCNPDAFVRSAYFHKDRGGKLAAGPVWDFDRAIGSYWDERSFRWDVWSGLGAPDYWRTGWWGVIAEDPEFRQDWIDRWQTLRGSSLSDASLSALVDSLAAQIGNAAAQRDIARWPDSASPWGDYNATIHNMKRWLTQRAGWIDEQFAKAPHVATGNGMLTFTPPPGAQLVYTLDGSDPRSLGGEIAPGALVSSTPVSVPASANIHVRSYRADLRDAFPSTPWSTALGGEASSPLSPKARLVNISSRAIVGSGANALIAGVVIADTEGKRYLSRAIGPGLSAFGASGYVADPQLSIFAANGSELFRNNGWETGIDAARLPAYSRRVGAFPLASGSADSALANEVSAGAYTVQVSTPTGQDGIGLAELYELDANGRTVNLSTRAYVRSDAGVLIGGFVVSGPAYKRMLIRAVGPALAGFGLAEALRDPVLTVYAGGEAIATNDRWEAAENASAIATASSRAGAFGLPQGSEDAAMLITLPPGAYTVEVKGKAGGEGVALLEIYEVP